MEGGRRSLQGHLTGAARVAVHVRAYTHTGSFNANQHSCPPNCNQYAGACHSNEYTGARNPDRYPGASDSDEYTHPTYRNSDSSS